LLRKVIQAKDLGYEQYEFESLFLHLELLRSDRAIDGSINHEGTSSRAFAKRGLGLEGRILNITLLRDKVVDDNFA